MTLGWPWVNLKGLANGYYKSIVHTHNGAIEFTLHICSKATSGTSKRALTAPREDVHRTTDQYQLMVNWEEISISWGMSRCVNLCLKCWCLLRWKWQNKCIDRNLVTYSKLQRVQVYAGCLKILLSVTEKQEHTVEFLQNSSVYWSVWFGLLH